LYNLDATSVKLVIVSILRGITQRWLPADTFLELLMLVLVFGHIISKPEARRKFEESGIIPKSSRCILKA